MRIPSLIQEDSTWMNSSGLTELHLHYIGYANGDSGNVLREVYVLLSFMSHNMLTFLLDY